MSAGKWGWWNPAAAARVYSPPTSSGENYLRGTLATNPPSETCDTLQNSSYYGELANMYPNIQGYLAGPGLNYEGLWWAAPAGVESGWGIDFAHQGDTIFATWFTYDQNGKGLWVIMPAPKTATGQYAGTLLHHHRAGVQRRSL